MTIKVTAQRPLGSGDEISVSIELENGSHRETRKFTMLTSLYISLGIERGEIDNVRFDEIERAEKISSAYKKGLFLLGYGALSRKKLKYKLKTKGFDDEISAEAVDMLYEHGYLDEKSDALREAELCVSKLWGKKRIIAHIYSKGFSDEAVKEVSVYLEDIDFAENCRLLIERSYKRQFLEALDDKNALMKLFASLERMGYSFSEIKEASEEIASD